MLRYSLTSLFKFLAGLLVVEAATALLVILAKDSGRDEVWILFGLLGLSIAVLGALFFTTVASHASRETVAQAQEDFLKEREKIRVQAERDKARVLRDSHRAMLRDRDRTQAKSSLRNGASLAAVLGIGGIMLFTQFMTFGLLLLSAAGGAAAGYGWRLRQERQTRDSNPASQLTRSSGGVPKALGRRVGRLLKKDDAQVDGSGVP